MVERFQGAHHWRQHGIQIAQKSQSRILTLSQSSLRLFRQPGSYCSARGQQRLALTELELVTLALASLGAITDAFWWHKPLGVREPMRIYCETEPIAEERSVDLVVDEVPETRPSSPLELYSTFVNSVMN